MTDIIINITSSIFDMFIVLIYYSKMFINRKDNINNIVFFSGYILMEVVLNIAMIVNMNIHTPLRVLFNFVVSVLTLYLISLFYNTHTIHRIFVVISFQVYFFLSEIILMLGFNSIFTLIGTEYYINDYIYNFLSKMVCFVLIIITYLIVRRKNTNYTIHYNLLILSTPVISILTLIALSYPSMDNVSFQAIQFASVLGLTFLNIINFYLLENIIKAKELSFKEQNLLQQIQYQSEKYDMIRTAYRDTRRIIHDTKKHYFFIRGAVEKNEYDIIPDYINRQLDELETKHILVNSGNLAIDSLVSNYIRLANQEGTPFDTKIRISPDIIPIDNYDLCVIIGNLLENSLNASRKIPSVSDRHILFEAYTSEKDFVIHISNSITNMNTESEKDSKNKILYHGYGIENVENIVEKYMGTFSYYIEDDEYHSIIVLPQLHHTL